MSSSDSFVEIDCAKDADWLAEHFFGMFSKRYELQAVLVARYDAKKKSGIVQWSYNLPASAFNGSENDHLLKILEECFLIHPKPHVHALKHDGIAETVCRLNKSYKQQYKMWFYPIRSGEHKFVLLAFPEPDKAKALPQDLNDVLATIFIALCGCLNASEAHSRLQTTEKFLREVGHDIASAVQSSVAKLRAISDGRITAGGIPNKAREIEHDIWNIFQIAESIGIIADTDYQLRLPVDFDLNAALRSVIKHFSSEANERNIRLRFDPQKDSLAVFGEKEAIQQAVGQLILNAIKYSYGGNDISIFTSERADDFLIRVINIGHPLPEGKELKHIWDFGYRGKLAKELHVNGSGIGLYTVKKIVSAHCGWVDAQSVGKQTEFFIHIPKKDALKRDLGYL